MPMGSRFTKLVARHSFAMTIPACEREASADSPLHVLCDNGPFWKIDHGDQLYRTFGAAKYHPLLLFLVAALAIIGWAMLWLTSRSGKERMERRPDRGFGIGDHRAGARRPTLEEASATILGGDL